MAERQCRHPPLAWRQEDSRIFFTSPERSVSRVPYLAPLKKIQGRSFFAFYSSLISQNIYTGLRHKAAQNSLFPLNFFPKGCFPFRYATDTDRLRKRVKWREKHCFIMNIYAPSPSLTKREWYGEGIPSLMKKKTGVLSPFLFAFQNMVFRKSTYPIAPPASSKFIKEYFLHCVLP